MSLRRAAHVANFRSTAAQHSAPTRPLGSRPIQHACTRSRRSSGGASAHGSNAPRSSSSRATSQSAAATTLATPTWAPCRSCAVPSAIAAMSSRWLTRCSQPDRPAVVPVAPIASPPRVRVSTSAVSASGVAGSAVSRPSAASSTGCQHPAVERAVEPQRAREVPVGGGGPGGGRVADPGAGQAVRGAAQHVVIDDQRAAARCSARSVWRRCARAPTASRRSR